MQFWKMNGAGNDFIILNNLQEGLSADCFPALARRLCERRLSIGADGLMVVERPQSGGDYRMLFYNSDGSAGEMCGNGFHLELELDPEKPQQTVAFFARYKDSIIPLKLSFLHHWSKFTIKPKNSYWRFNKYVAYIDKSSTIVICHASAMDTFKRELKFLPYVFMESKRSFITRIQYWLTRPFFKNKKIWLMYDKPSAPAGAVQGCAPR